MELIKDHVFLVSIFFIVLIASIGAWSYAPLWMTNQYNIKNDKDRAELTDKFRKTIGQGIGGLAFVATFAFTIFQFFQQQEQTSRQLANQQFIEGAKLLKEKAISTRMAGLYAIERSAKTESKYLIPAIHAAIGFIKNPIISAEKKEKEFNWPPIEADTQSSINILSNLNQIHHVDIDLRDAYLVRGEFTILKTSTAFTNANFQNSFLYGADMRGLDLSNARFDGGHMSDWEAYAPKWLDSTPNDSNYIDIKHKFTIHFDRAVLINAKFDHVWMGGATFEGTCLAHTGFWDADLPRADFRGADMGNNQIDKCNFNGEKAYFNDARLIDAIFKNVDVNGVNFTKANLSGADFSEALNMEKAIFDKACTDDKTSFPATFKINLDRCPKKQ